MNLIAYKTPENGPVKTLVDGSTEAKGRFMFWAQSTGHEVIMTEHGVDIFPPADWINDAGTIRKKTEIELINDGMITLPPDKKVEGDAIVEKSLIEKINDGIEALPEGLQIQDGKLYPIGSTPKRRARAKDYIKEMSPEGNFVTTVGDWMDAVAEYLEAVKTETGVAYPAKLASLMNKRAEIKGRHP